MCYVTNVGVTAKIAGCALQRAIGLPLFFVLDFSQCALAMIAMYLNKSSNYFAKQCKAIAYLSYNATTDITLFFLLHACCFRFPPRSLECCKEHKAPTFFQPFATTFWRRIWWKKLHKKCRLLGIPPTLGAKCCTQNRK